MTIHAYDYTRLRLYSPTTIHAHDYTRLRLHAHTPPYAYDYTRIRLYSSTTIHAHDYARIKGLHVYVFAFAFAFAFRRSLRLRLCCHRRLRLRLRICLRLRLRLLTSALMSTPSPLIVHACAHMRSRLYKPTSTYACHSTRSAWGGRLPGRGGEGLTPSPGYRERLGFRATSPRLYMP